MSANYYSVPKMSSIPSDVEVSTIPSSSHRHHHKSRHVNKSFTELTQNESIRQVSRNKNHRLKESSSFSNGYGVPYSNYNYSDVGIIESDVIYPAGSSGHNRHNRRNKVKESNKIKPVSETLINEKPTSVTGEQIGKARSPLFRVDAENTIGSHGGSHHGHKSRKNRSRSNGYGRIGENLFFIEQGSNQKAPTGYTYKGRIEVQTMECDSGSVPAPAPRPIAPQPCPPVVNPCSGPCPPGWHQVVIPGSGAGISSGGYDGGNYSFSSGSAGGFGGFSGSSSGQLITDYVVESTADGGFGGSSGYSGHFGGGSSGGGFGKTRVKVIELWEKKSKDSHRKSSASSSSDRSHHKNTTTTITQKVDISQLRDDLMRAMERMFENSQKHTGGSSGKESEVRVIVQPIQPVFYMPRQPEPSHPVQPHPVIPQPTPAPGPVPQPHPTPGPGPQPNPGPRPVPHPIPAPVPVQPVRAPSPKIIYVPRNVYVPVVKPVFVPRERVITRPQVVHVARPVLVDRPVPVTQRPIIIDRERPIPVPVRVGGSVAPSQPNIIREEYVYQENTPYSYGGRPAEYAAGINYGYMPSQVEHQYTVSPPEQTVTTVYENQGQTGGGQNLIEVLDQTVNSTWQPVQSSSFLNQYGSSAMNLMQGGGGYETGGYGNNQQYEASATYSKGDESSCEELLRLISGGRVASGGSSY